MKSTVDLSNSFWYIYDRAKLISGLHSNSIILNLDSNIFGDLYSDLKVVDQL